MTPLQEEYLALIQDQPGLTQYQIAHIVGAPPSKVLRVLDALVSRERVDLVRRVTDAECRPVWKAYAA